MNSTITAKRRREIAEQLGLNEAYVWQCMSGRRDMHAAEAARIERETGGELRRWDLRTRDWWLVWPELVGAPGAPAVPTPKRKAAKASAAATAGA